MAPAPSDRDDRDEASNHDEVIPHTKLHRDGSLWSTGQTRNGEQEGYWEWFRADGTIMRSGTFDSGARVGEWITYDKNGAPYKTTQMKRA